MDNSIEDNKNSNIETNQKKCIASFIKGCIIINKSGFKYISTEMQCN